MVKIRISYNKDGEAAPVMAALDRIAKLSKIKYNKGSKNNIIYVEVAKFKDLS